MEVHVIVLSHVKRGKSIANDAVAKITVVVVVWAMRPKLDCSR